jgi:hypothetical protein
MNAVTRPAPTIEEWKPVVKGSLRGFAKVRLPSGMVLNEVTVLVANGTAWASPPGKPMLGRDGNVMRDEAGKPRYSPIVTFSSKELRNRFSDGIIEALLQRYPDALT